jgi:hypothetical protein
MHFLLMCSSSTFLSHSDNTSFFSLPISFSMFQHESYVSMWGHYGCKILEVFSRPFNEVSSLTTNILWCIGLLSMKDCAPSTFLRTPSKELGSSGFVAML